MSAIPKNKRKNLQSAKTARKNLLYSSDQVIELYKICPNTLSNWVKAGLRPICTNPKRLFKGEDLNAFHKSRRAEAKVKLGQFEVYCVACKCIHSLLDDPIYVWMKKKAVLVAVGCPTNQTFAPRFLTHNNYQALCVLRGDNPSAETPD